MENQRTNCYKCVYFYVSWDKNFPNGCRAFGFKTREMPSVSVYKSSGKSCQAFKSKDVK